MTPVPATRDAHLQNALRARLAATGVFAAALLCATAMASLAPAAVLAPDQVLSSISIAPLDPPNPVTGADGRIHLAYELLAANTSALFITFDRIEAVDASGKVLSSLAGDALAAMTRSFASADRSVPPGGTAVILMDVSFGPGETVPATVAARITATRQVAGAGGKPQPMPDDSPFAATFTFTDAAVAIGKPAVVVASPLRGAGWVAVNGCCDSITSHRGAILVINGHPYLPERFAIDWVQLDRDGRLFTGDLGTLANYGYYGTPIHAAADGVVVNLYDEADEQVPGTPARGITADNLGGNMLVIDIGGGNFTFYAHMQRGSLRVKMGDTVKTGDVIGLLGNTGNTTAPHLHFHVMDGPSPIAANGLPYVLTKFDGKGVLDEASEDGLFDRGEPAKLDPGTFAGPHENRLPLNNEVVDFAID